MRSESGHVLSTKVLTAALSHISLPLPLQENTSNDREKKTKNVISDYVKAGKY